VLLKRFLFLIWKLFAISARTLLTILIVYEIKIFLIFTVEALPLIKLIAIPLFYLFFWFEIFTTFYLLFRNRWYAGFIEEHSIFVHKFLHGKVYMPHDFFLDVFFFSNYRFSKVSYTYCFKLFILFLMLKPFTFFVLLVLTLLIFFFLISGYVLFCKLWDNSFMLHNDRVLGKMTGWEGEAAKYFDPNVFIFLFIIGHNGSIIFWHHKIIFFGRRNIFYHNLPLWEKISIFWKTYFKIINRPSNFFFFTIAACYFSLYQTIFFTNWSGYPLNNFVKVFLYQLNYYLMENFLYIIRYKIGQYGLKHIVTIDGQLLFM
jgi:hypothetical protein